MKYGFRKSPPDPRDKVANPMGLVIKDEVDMRSSCMPTVFDQGDLGSCTANAVAACLQRDLSLDRHLQGLTSARRQSRLDIYRGERALEGELDQGDTGAYGRDGFKFAQQTGVLLERVWPYDISTFEDPPPTGFTRHKLAKPYAVVEQTVDHVKAVLSNDQMIAFGFTVYSSFEYASTSSSGVIPLPGAGESVLGGHEMALVGYLADHPNYFLARNSWGNGFGILGYCLFPTAYLVSNLATDLRTIVRSTWCRTR